MRILSKFCSWLSILLLVVTTCVNASAQLRDEIENKKSGRLEVEALERDVVQAKKDEKKYKFSSVFEFSSNYETNPRFTPAREGDASAHLKYSLFFKRKLVHGWLFNFAHTVDGIGYSELNDLTSLFNHSRMSLDRSLNKFVGFGMGYDFSSFYYLEDQSNDSYFHKGFIYVKHNITKKIYQKLALEEGVKDYPHSPAYLDSVATFQDVDRRDYRHAVEYSFGMPLADRWFFRFLTKYMISDSNALYMDYHDYRSWDFSPYISYRISEKYLIGLSAGVSDKNYKSRQVPTQSYKQEDVVYNGDIELKYNVNKSNMVSLGYGYDDGTSNDPSAEYVNQSVHCKWQYKF